LILFEEVKDLPEKPVNEIALPLLNISRRMMDGTLNHKEPHQQTTWIGSAGYVGSFAHDKCIETTINAILEPNNFFSWGGTYEIPVYYGLLNRDFVQNLKDSGTYDEASFSREFMSRWTHSVEGSLFDFERMNKLRKIKKAEWFREDNEDVFYVGSIDVARHSARTIFIVFKVRRSAEHFLISVVNIIPMEGRNFAYQTEKIKELDQAFDFDSIIIDSNGLGIGLVDFLMTETVSEIGVTYPAWNVQNIKEYKNMERDQKIGGVPKIHVLKTNQHSAGLIHSNAYNVLFSGKVRLLVDEKEAKDKVTSTKKGRKMGLQERLRAMEPYKMTSLLISETTNLKINRQNTYLKLEMIRTDAEKDTFSALEYGLYKIAEMEKEYYAKLRKGKRSWSGYTFKN
jgi:hypothetical protein